MALGSPQTTAILWFDQILYYNNVFDIHTSVVNTKAPPMSSLEEFTASMCVRELF